MTSGKSRHPHSAWKLVKEIISLVLMSLSIFSCTRSGDTIYIDDDEELKNDTRPIVFFVFNEGSMGDMSYVDAMYRGVAKAANKDSLLLSLAEVPAEESKVDFAVNYFFNYMKSVDTNRRALIIMANNNYEHLITNYSKKLAEAPNVSLLLAESSDTSLPVYTISLPTYGACYMAGRLADEALTDVSRVLVASANRQNTDIADMREGFARGLADGSRGVTADYVYMADGDHGFDSADSAYHMSYDIDKTCQMVLPLCGGTIQGFLRYNREHPQSFYTVGIDDDMQIYSQRVPFSIVKHIDTVVEEWITRWRNGEKQELHQKFGLESGMTEIVLADKFKNSLSAPLDKLRKAAMEKEKEHEER